MNGPMFRQSSWMVTVPLVAIAIAYLTFVWWPGLKAIKAMQAQVETQRQFVAQSTGLQASLTAAQQELDKTESVAKRWEAAAPRKKELPALYGKINALAKDSGLTVARFDPQPLVGHESIQEIPLALGCSGVFSRIYDFLGRVEGLPVAVWVKSLKLGKADKDTKDTQCELELVVFSNNP